ncbi:sulfotransferase family protein [Streptomyces sp. Je 1-369]|uniref:sulfotransferase family protein n=1 Tax=Streptomyces sp. Je 1-369 TaxID=2966192 RepID=UPI0022866ECD|nr:sulfotransferase [Streptomyces sp. Je 1-369]WAL94593.1 sulfotransferase [Streptomyces sp. Je 1-369]
MTLRNLTFVIGTGRSGSTALSRILNSHPDVLSLNEYMASVGDAAFPEGVLPGAEFWETLFRPTPYFAGMLRSGVPMPEFLYTRTPGGRYAPETTGIPALSLMVLPHLTDDPDGLLDAVRAAVVEWPVRTAAAHHEALFDLLAARFGRSAVVERSGYSTGWVPGLRAAFPYAKFVHLFRDGPDCALSMSRHPGYRVITLMREIAERTGAESLGDLTDEQVRSLPPELAPLLGERFDPALVRDRAFPVRPFGDLWSELVVQGVRFLGDVPADQCMTLGYEDLLDAPQDELTRLAAFVGVDPDPHWLKNACTRLDPSRRGSARKQLTATEYDGLRAACTEGTRTLLQAAPGEPG